MNTILALCPSLSYKLYYFGMKQLCHKELMVDSRVPIMLMYKELKEYFGLDRFLKIFVDKSELKIANKEVTGNNCN